MDVKTKGNPHGNYNFYYPPTISPQLISPKNGCNNETFVTKYIVIGVSFVFEFGSLFKCVLYELKLYVSKYFAIGFTFCFGRMKHCLIG